MTAYATETGNPALAGILLGLMTHGQRPSAAWPMAAPLTLELNAYLSTWPVASWQRCPGVAVNGARADHPVDALAKTAVPDAW